jgi:acyl-[acyl-carrier-protein]-phospholipid O-acyltransferase/long-chain-fatty-acid--[acyl-carrier-protein] ligase
MNGYLGRPEQTAEVLRDGWYVTGDIVSEDQDGFLTILDRVSRYSKIGGEMVPHVKLEQKLLEFAIAEAHALANAPASDSLPLPERSELSADDTAAQLVVTSVRDAQRGERLVVLHTFSDRVLASVLQRLEADPMPNLWKPRRTDFYRVEELPRLGTGKLDLRKAREMAERLATAETANLANR